MLALQRIVCAAALAAAASAWAQDPANGQVREQGGALQAYSAVSAGWVGLEAFWLEFAENSERGRFWGRSAEYPPYGEVGEHDTLLIELEQGSCLMYFFHERWRRAQDVRRWDARFNEALGCPYVFD